LGEPADKSEIATVENINRSIANALGGHIGSVDAARILSVPKTHNYKSDPPRREKFRSLDKVDYSLDDFKVLPTLLKTERVSQVMGLFFRTGERRRTQRHSCTNCWSIHRYGQEIR